MYRHVYGSLLYVKKQDSKTMNFIIITYSAFYHLKFFNLSTELCSISLIRNKLFNNKFTDLNTNTFMYLQEFFLAIIILTMF